MYSSPGRRSLSDEAGKLDSVIPLGVWPDTRVVRSVVEPIGRPMSAAEDVRRVFPVDEAARLNICGILARLSEDAVPSTG